MASRTDVFISSTSMDLPVHRQEAMDACMRMGMFPLMMEHLPASDNDAVRVSLSLTDEAEIYLGIFAWRYGYIPRGYDISITEIEYNRAVQRRIPRLIFIMGNEHDSKGLDVEKGSGAIKLEALKERLMGENIVNFFRSPEDLRAKVIQGLAKHRVPETITLHSLYATDIPKSPEPYVAHPYSLIQTDQLVGRREELDLLTDWVARSNSDAYKARLLNLVAIGGMGKTALTWTWFNSRAALEFQMAGSIWWSFYESDARFDNFVLRALAYVSGRPVETIERTTQPAEREEQLFNYLDKRPYLVVLDGLERILNAYARADAAYMADDELDERAANQVAGALGLPANMVSSFTGQHRLRKTADPRVGNFLRKLATLKNSRILISSRLYPADLQSETGFPIAGSFAYFMTGLRGIDALKLWRALGVSGSGDKLLAMFETFDNHPLLIRALAGEVARFRRAPRDFDKWLEANPGFDPFSLPIVQRKSHVLAYAMQGLSEASSLVLQTVAAFRMPASYETLVGVLVGKNKPFWDEQSIDIVLTELEDRGLIGWDRRANRYDIHPIVRGVAWNVLDDETRLDVYKSLYIHFESIPSKPVDHITSVEDLTAAIELFNTMIGMKQFDQAYSLMYTRLLYPLYNKLGATRQLGELLEMLFPHGLEQNPALSSSTKQVGVMNQLANCYIHSEPGRTKPLYRRAAVFRAKEGNKAKVCINLNSLAYASLITGDLYDAEFYAAQAIVIAAQIKEADQDPMSLCYLGLCASIKGRLKEAEAYLNAALRIGLKQKHKQSEGIINAFLAQALFIANRFTEAQNLANRAWVLAHDEKIVRDFIRAARLQGSIALELGDFRATEDRLNYALTNARSINYMEEELQAIVALATLALRQNWPDESRQLLDDVWEAAERGPYPLIQADALIVLSEIERAAGHHPAAIQAAQEAYELAWRDGTPHHYQRGLEKAKQQLNELGAAYPRLAPFNQTNRHPIPPINLKQVYQT